MAVRWKNDPQLMQIAEWPPVYGAIYGGALILGLSPLVTAHLLTSLFSGLIIVLAGKISLKLTEDPLSAMFSSILVLFAPLPLWLSASMLSEPLYVVIALVMCLLFLQWLQHGKQTWLLLTTLFCCLLTMTRLESWPLAFFLSLAILYRERNKKGLLNVLLIYAFPILWALTSWERFGHPLAVVKDHALDSQVFYLNTPNKHWLIMLGYLKYFPITLISFSWILFSRQANKKTKWFGIASFVALVTQFIFTWNHIPTVFPERVTILPGILGLILSGIFLRNCFHSPSRRIFKLASMILAFSVFLGNLYFITQFRPSYRKDMAELGLKLKNSQDWKQKAKSLLIGSDLESHELPVMAIMSGFPEVFRYVFFDPQSSRLLLPYSNPPQMFLLKSIPATQILLRSNPRLVATKIESVMVVSEFPNLHLEISK